jgi:hypothetical protein
MTLEQSEITTSTEPDSTEILFMRVGMSLCLYYIIILAGDLANMLIEQNFKLDLTYLLYFWMVSCVCKGNTSACKWGIFFMLCNTVAGILIGWKLCVNPAETVFNNKIVTSGSVPFYIGAASITCIWSLLNLKYLIQLIKITKTRFWTQATVAGYVIFFILVAGIIGLVAMDYREKIPAEYAETHYADLIDFMEDIAIQDGITSDDIPQFEQYKQAHPEILLAEFSSMPRSSMTVFTNLPSTNDPEKYAVYKTLNFHLKRNASLFLTAR